MQPGTIKIKRGQEKTVRVTLKVRSSVDGSLSNPDISGTPNIKLRVFPNLKKGTAASIEKTGSDISVVTDGTSGQNAVIEVTFAESDTNTLDPTKARYWQAFSQKSNVTTPYDPGIFIIEPSGDYS